MRQRKKKAREDKERIRVLTDNGRYLYVKISRRYPYKCFNLYSPAYPAHQMAAITIKHCFTEEQLMQAIRTAFNMLYNHAAHKAAYYQQKKEERNAKRLRWD